MNTVTVSIELPRDLLGALNVSEAALAPRLQELIAVELVREGSISTGKGAEILGITKWEFIQVLARHGVDYFTETPEELHAQVERARVILGDDRR